jgi:hypothetical protein
VRWLRDTQAPVDSVLSAEPTPKSFAISAFGFRISDFGFPSDFGLRISDFHPAFFRPSAFDLRTSNPALE